MLSRKKKRPVRPFKSTPDRLCSCRHPDTHFTNQILIGGGNISDFLPEKKYMLRDAGCVRLSGISRNAAWACHGFMCQHTAIHCCIQTRTIEQSCVYSLLLLGFYSKAARPLRLHKYTQKTVKWWIFCLIYNKNWRAFPRGESMISVRSFFSLKHSTIELVSLPTKQI